MLALPVLFRDLGGFQVQTGFYGIYKCRFPSSAMARDHADLPLHQVLDLFYVLPGLCRDTDALVPDLAIQGSQIFNLRELVIVVSIDLVEQQHRLNSIGFCSDEKPVDESGEGGWIVQGDQEKDHIYIRGNNMGLLRKVYRPPDDIVLAFVDLVDHPFILCALFVKLELHPVTYGYRIGALNALDPEFSLDAAVVKLAVFRFNQIPAARGFIYRSRHATKVRKLLFIR